MIVDQYGKQIKSTHQVVQEKALTAMKHAARVELTAAYDAAQTTGENQKHWRFADDLSATAANSRFVRETLRKRARYECLQSNSFGCGIVSTLANDTIGTGPTLQVAMGRDMSRQIEQRFSTWCRRIGLAKKLRTARLSKCVDGETFIVRTTNPENRDPVQLDIKVIESDQVSTPGWMEGRQGMVDGIVFDVYDNPAVYHVLKQHPGDMWVINAFTKVDVLAKDMIHLFNEVRPGQKRGVPEVTPALPLFAYLRRYTLATILAAETAADFAAIIKTTGNAYNSEGLSADPSVQPFDSVNIDRGMMTSLPYGWEMQQFKPEQPTTQYQAFRNAILQEIARCVHMPENKALGSSAAYNFSSATLDDQIYWQSIDIERELIWVQDCLERIFEWWWDEAVEIDGYLPLYPYIDLPPHKFVWPPKRANNPSEEATTAISLVNAGLMLDSQYLESRNIDPDWFNEEMEKQIERRKRWGTVSQETATVMSSEGDGDSADAVPQHDVQATAMNGAQISSATQIVKDIAMRLLPRDAGVAQLQLMFNWSKQQAESAVGTAGTDTFTPAGVSETVLPSNDQSNEQPGVDSVASKAFMGLSRMQWKNNGKAMMDVAEKYNAGEVTRTQAGVMLSGLGLSPDDIAMWLGDEEAVVNG